MIREDLNVEGLKESLKGIGKKSQILVLHQEEGSDGFSSFCHGDIFTVAAMIVSYLAQDDIKLVIVTAMLKDALNQKEGVQ